MYAEQASVLPHVVAWRSVSSGRPHRILPDGCLDLIWSAGQVFVAGPDTFTEVAESAPGRRSFALRFAAGAGAAVLGLPADELTDLQVPLADLWPGADVRRIAEAADPAAALLDAAVRRWQDPDPAMVEVAARARAGQPVETIAAACGLSPRQLQRRCRTAFGYGPKTLVRVLRMQRAVALARRGQALAEVSAAAGYADQAHLSRDVKALAGVPLRTLLMTAAQPTRTDRGSDRPGP
jgi:AraC-like DNA-binding protein